MNLVTKLSLDFDSRLAQQILDCAPEGLILDLDNTIIWEADYFLSAVREVESRFAISADPARAQKLRKYLVERFQSGSRRNLFQRGLSHAAIDSKEIEVILSVMVQHRVVPGLRPRKWVTLVAGKLKAKMGILTNGNPEVQANKIRNILPNEPFGSLPVIFANEIEPKPNPSGVHQFAEKWRIREQKLLLVGDSSVDKNCAFAAGCMFLSSNGAPI